MSCLLALWIICRISVNLSSNGFGRWYIQSEEKDTISQFSKLQTEACREATTATRDKSEEKKHNVEGTVKLQSEAVREAIMTIVEKSKERKHKEKLALIREAIRIIEEKKDKRLSGSVKLTHVPARK